MTLSAASGLYTTKTQFLSIRERILLISSDGKHQELSEAEIETNKGHIVSHKPVTVDFNGGDIRADGLEVVNNGELVQFVGSVVFRTRPAVSENHDVHNKPSGASTSILGGQSGPNSD